LNQASTISDAVLVGSPGDYENPTEGSKIIEERSSYS